MGSPTFKVGGRCWSTCPVFSSRRRPTRIWMIRPFVFSGSSVIIPRSGSSAETRTLSTIFCILLFGLLWDERKSLKLAM